MRILIACETSGIARRPVPGFPKYLVTQDGRVVSLWKRQPRFLKLATDQKGYAEGLYVVQMEFAGSSVRGLPPLVATDMLAEPERGSGEWKAWSRVHRMPPGPERARLRSRSFPGMMAAAAEQWAGHAVEQIERAQA